MSSRNFQPKFRRITNHFRRNLWDLAKIDKEKPKDHNMSPVGLGNSTRILTVYAQKSPRTGRDDCSFFDPSKVVLEGGVAARIEIGEKFTTQCSRWVLDPRCASRDLVAAVGCHNSSAWRAMKAKRIFNPMGAARPMSNKSPGNFEIILADFF